MKPRQAMRNKDIIRLQTDNHDCAQGWIIIDGPDVVLSNQKHGCEQTGKVQFSRRAFNTLIDWYNRDQKLRKP